MGIDPKPPANPASPRKRSCLPKALIGCGCAVFLAGLMVIAAAAGLFYFGYRQVDEFTSPYVAQGYQHTVGQIVEETETVTEPTVYSAQAVTIRQGADDNLAIACQVGEVDGVVHGDIDFFGQTLTVMPNGRVLGDLEAKGI